jgi:hypothetical protein
MTADVQRSGTLAPVAHSIPSRLQAMAYGFPSHISIK